MQVNGTFSNFGAGSGSSDGNWPYPPSSSRASAAASSSTGAAPSDDNWQYASSSSSGEESSDGNGSYPASSSTASTAPRNRNLSIRRRHITTRDRQGCTERISSDSACSLTSAAVSTPIRQNMIQNAINTKRYFGQLVLQYGKLRVAEAINRHIPIQDFRRFANGQRELSHLEIEQIAQVLRKTQGTVSRKDKAKAQIETIQTRAQDLYNRQNASLTDKDRLKIRWSYAQAIACNAVYHHDWEVGQTLPGVNIYGLDLGEHAIIPEHSVKEIILNDNLNFCAILFAPNDGGPLILAFRGTEKTSALNWKTNANPDGIGIDSYNENRARLLGAVLKHKVNENHITVCGHSLGGALAQYFIMDHASSLPIDEGFIFASAAPSEHLRLEYENYLETPREANALPPPLVYSLRHRADIVPATGFSIPEKIEIVTKENKSPIQSHTDIALVLDLQEGQYSETEGNGIQGLKRSAVRNMKVGLVDGGRVIAGKVAKRQLSEYVGNERGNKSEVSSILDYLQRAVIALNEHNSQLKKAVSSSEESSDDGTHAYIPSESSSSANLTLRELGSASTLESDFESEAEATRTYWSRGCLYSADLTLRELGSASPFGDDSSETESSSSDSEDDEIQESETLPEDISHQNNSLNTRTKLSQIEPTPLE